MNYDIDLFETGQYGGLYVVIYRDHINGDSMEIYALPNNTHAITDGLDGHPPKNKDMVKVYGKALRKTDLLGGVTYSNECHWLHEGRWKEDFEKLVAEKLAILKQKRILHKAEIEAKEKLEQQRIKRILDSY